MIGIFFSFIILKRLSYLYICKIYGYLTATIILRLVFRLDVSFLEDCLGFPQYNDIFVGYELQFRA